MEGQLAHSLPSLSQTGSRWARVVAMCKKEKAAGGKADGEVKWSAYWMVVSYKGVCVCV